MLLLMSALLVVLDQATKWWAKASFAQGGSMPLALGFNFTYVENTGAAFGILRGVSFQLFGWHVDGVVLLGLLSLAVSVALIWYLLVRGRDLGTGTRLALHLVLAGAVGNMIDRLALRYVIDFIHFQAGNFNFPVFNVADSCVVIGAILLFAQGLFGSPQAERARA